MIARCWDPSRTATLEAGSDSPIRGYQVVAVAEAAPSVESSMVPAVSVRTDC